MKNRLMETDYAKEALKYCERSKVEKAFNLAYEYGHAGGLQEVSNYFRDLLDLLTN